jgi:hypothetical protein
MPADTPDTPEAAADVMRRLMRQFSVDPAMLEDDDSGLSLSLSSGLGVVTSSRRTRRGLWLRKSHMLKSHLS